MADNCTTKNDLVTAIYDLASNFENAIGAFGDDVEAREKAENDIAFARVVAQRHNQSCCRLEVERLQAGIAALIKKRSGAEAIRENLQSLLLTQNT